MKIKENLFSALISMAVLTVIVVAVISFFIYKQVWIGPIFFFLGLICLFSLRLFNRSIMSVWPDIVFGFIDNGVLVFAAIIGAQFAGVLGAIIGGAAGNAITDGFGGIFEGYVAQKLRKRKIKEKRTPVSSAIGKMAGCLLIVGLILTIIWTIMRLWL